jgi:diaminohydroxyphosphoribosylaminopyrimidine deaminase/5-amino-6-(5-phosphoribosylamino)uracil reductase
VTIDETALMRMAARAAARGIGRVEPNPAVGCVIASRDGRVLGIGHHRVFGGPHAEVEALANCRASGHDPRGAVMVVTLEPCNHFGKTGPCSEAVIGAGIGRVVYARADPNPPASGGAARLVSAGVDVARLDTVPEARDLSAAFCRRLATGLPWVIAKWAQSLDGRVASRTGSSQWISGPRSRKRVHRLRAGVDAIVTGVGTVLADDPMLTARGVPVRRIARRVVLDSRLRTPMGSALVRSAGEAPVMVVCLEASMAKHADRVAAMRSAGVEVVGVPAAADGRVDVRAALRFLVAHHDAMRVMVEAGPGVMGALVRDDLIDETIAFIAPMVLGDAAALPVADAGVPRELADAMRFEVRSARRCGADVMLRCVRSDR